MITSEPGDAYVTEGDSAYFQCSYTGSSELPLWTINGDYFSTSYPPRHMYHSRNQVLEVFNTQLADNGSTYQCIVFTESSRTASLFVYKFENSSTGGKSTLLIGNNLGIIIVDVRRAFMTLYLQIVSASEDQRRDMFVIYRLRNKQSTLRPLSG